MPSRASVESGARLYALEVPPSPEVITKGNLFEFLAKRYLPGYFERLDKYFPRPELGVQILPILQKYLPLVLESSLCTRSELIGSTGKCLLYDAIASVFDIFPEKAELPSKHWDYRPAIAKKIDILKLRLKPQAYQKSADFLSTFIEDPDLDIKVRLDSEETKTVDLAKAVYAQLAGFGHGENGVSELQVTREVNPKDQKEYEGIAFDIVWSEDIRIHFLAAQIATNPNIGVMKLSIHDRSSDKYNGGKRVADGRSIFHIDFTDMPFTAEAADSDARAGATNNWGDKTPIHLRSVGGQVTFEIPSASVEELLVQDEFIIKPEDITAENFEDAGLSETVFRMLRMHEYFSQETVLTVDDETGDRRWLNDLSQLDKFYQYLKPNNLFDLARRVRRLKELGIGFKARSLTLVQKELAICFWIDPWQTIQFIRDSGISQLIPGWSHLTRDDWNRVLNSDQLCMEAVKGTATTRLSERNTAEYWTKQRQLYRGGNYFDGLERVMRALGTKPNKEIIAFRQLWVRPKLERTREKISIPEDYSLRFRVGRRILIYVQDDEPASAAHIGRVLLRAGALETIPWSELELTAETEIYGHIESLVRANKLEPVDPTTDKILRLVTIKQQLDEKRTTLTYRDRIITGDEVAELFKWLKSLCVVYAYFKEFSSGITAKDSNAFYHAASITLFGSLDDFDHALLDLKLLGLVKKGQLDVDFPVEKVTDIYTHRAIPTPLTPFRTLTDDPIKAAKLAQYYAEVAGYTLTSRWDEERGRKVNLQRVKNCVTDVERVGIRTYEALQAITRYDLDMMNQDGVLKGSPDTLMRKAESLRRTCEHYLAREKIG